MVITTKNSILVFILKFAPLSFSLFVVFLKIEKDFFVS